MRYAIRCNNFKHACLLCNKFAKLYSKEKPRYTATAASVRAGDDLFIFHHHAKTSNRPESIEAETFCKKYFSSPSQESQTP